MRSFQLQRPLPAAAILLVILSACGEGAASAGRAEPAPAGASGAGCSAGAGGSQAGGSAGRPASSASAAPPTAASEPAAPDTCDAHLPAPFGALCAGCHNAAPSDARYPDLAAFKGGESALIALVRSGGKTMPAFDAAQVSDAALRELYQALRARGARPLSLGRASPLFASPEALTPISFTRDDGVLITRGAGRVRQRHELEGTFGPFGPFYFEDRTYGFLIEDYTPRGESRLRVTYLPIARPEDKTNFRCFKIYGDGNVFSSNTGMDSDVPLPSLAGSSVTDYAQQIAPFARVQAHELTRNARSNAPIQKGDLFEFEFGIFIEPGEVAANARTSYYTDTFRYRVGAGGLTPENADASGQPGPTSLAAAGGGTTLAWLYAEPDTYFSQMALNIQHEHVQRFVEGRRLFHTDFSTGAHSEPGNPVLSAQANKAGPLLVTTRCDSCHVKNGGGQTLAGTLDQQSSQVFKLYGPDEPRGSQLHLQHGSAKLSRRDTRSVTLADGSAVELSRPQFELQREDATTPIYSPRISRRLLGLGLLEAIDEQSLLAQADPQDCDGDGISGRPNIVATPVGEGARVGRFGWRAEKISVEHQVADALAADLGVQTRMIPGPGGESELDDTELARLTTYMRLLGVPARRDVDDATVTRGEALFRGVGCAKCHVPSVITGQSHPFVELRGQRIQPFSDLLLHDLGPDLADVGGEARDGEGDEPGTHSEWRTAPLWGIGLSQKVQGYTALLHDGRAGSVLEAVLWHGGEATAVRERVTQLSRDEREALLRFVESL